MRMQLNPEQVKFDENGLVAAIIQDAVSKKVLMFAWMNRESLRLTIETGETVFYSRSRQEIWHKGLTSGNRQRVISIATDCDRDALLVMVETSGPACHTLSESCFEAKAEGDINDA